MKRGNNMYKNKIEEVPIEYVEELFGIEGEEAKEMYHFLRGDTMENASFEERELLIKYQGCFRVLNGQPPLTEQEFQDLIDEKVNSTKGKKL